MAAITRADNDLGTDCTAIWPISHADMTIWSSHDDSLKSVFEYDAWGNSMFCATRTSQPACSQGARGLQRCDVALDAIALRAQLAPLDSGRGVSRSTCACAPSRLRATDDDSHRGQGAFGAVRIRVATATRAWLPAVPGGFLHKVPESMLRKSSRLMRPSPSESAVSMMTATSSSVISP